MYLREMGGISGVQRIVDRQVGPSCGLEAVENIIQLYLRVGNSLSETHLRPLAARLGFLVQSSIGITLDVSGYQPLLSSFGIPAGWYPFEHRLLIAELRENRPAIAVLDAHVLDPADYPLPGSWHAVTITNIGIDSGVGVTRYIGEDSNFPGQERAWNAHNLRRAAVAALTTPLLIASTSAPLYHGAKYYLNDGTDTYRATFGA